MAPQGMEGLLALGSGRNPLSPAVRVLIRRMAAENVLWGQKRSRSDESKRNSERVEYRVAVDQGCLFHSDTEITIEAYKTILVTTTIDMLSIFAVLEHQET